MGENSKIHQLQLSMNCKVRFIIRNQNPSQLMEYISNEGLKDLFSQKSYGWGITNVSK